MPESKEFLPPTDVYLFYLIRSLTDNFVIFMWNIHFSFFYIKNLMPSHQISNTDFTTPTDKEAKQSCQPCGVAALFIIFIKLVMG